MKLKISTILMSIVIAVAGLPTILQADTEVPLPSAKEQIMLLADNIGAQSGIASSMIKNIIRAESNYDPSAIGDHSLAHGIVQYHEAEFDDYESKYFKKTGNHLNYDSSEDQLKLMAWQFKNYPLSRNDWSTYRRMYGVKSRGTIKK
jgi:hypothetical protein